MSSSVVPSEEDLKAALKVLKTDNPTLGISKLQALLLESHKDWTVSEKRVRKVLQNEGLTSAPSSGASAKKIWPSSKVLENLDPTPFSKKIEVKYFDRAKGKGLIAKEEIGEREIVWKEDPFILAPEWQIFDLQMASRHCGHCTSPLALDSGLTVGCPNSSPTSPLGSPCPLRYCNRLCLKRSRITHPLLCRVQNPASVPLMDFIRKSEWIAPHALAHLTSRILLAQQQPGGENEFKTDFEVVKGLSTLGLEERFKDSGREPDHAVWEQCYQLYIQALHEPKEIENQKKLAKILKKPLDSGVEKEFFTYEAFLRGLGRVSLNIESHGGIYVVHSHLNHSCTPNISVRHIDTRYALSRISLIAHRVINPGEELFISYVNPKMGVKARRKELVEWGFGECRCKRCLEDVKNAKNEKEDGEIGAGAWDGDLEKELKAGLGVL